MASLLTAFIVAFLILLGVLAILENRRRISEERIASLERKVEQLMNHLDLAPAPVAAASPTPFRVTDPLSTPSSGGAAVANRFSATVVDLVRRGKKIEAIKVYREQTGVGLKEAKDAVEQLERDGV